MIIDLLQGIVSDGLKPAIVEKQLQEMYREKKPFSILTESRTKLILPLAVEFDTIGEVQCIIQSCMLIV